MAVEEYDVVETVFRRQNFAEYYMTLYGFADSLEASEPYNTNRPGHVPPGARFREHVAAMKDFGVGADRGDTLFKERRQAVRDLSELDMDASVCYMKTLAIHRKDPTLLQSLRLPLKEIHPKNTRRAIIPPHAIEIHVEVKHVKNETGAIMIMGSHVRNGGPYLINLCKGDPTVEANWYNPGGHHKSCRQIIIRNLERASIYYVRMRTDGPEGEGNWSHPVSIIVL